MNGITELAEQVFALPVRRGLPIGITGLIDVVKSPMYSTGVGLVLYGGKNVGDMQFQKGNDTTLFNKLTSRMKGWMKEFF
jgi:cell division protein FtsA